MVASWGRPLSLRPKKYDVLPLTEHDFASKAFPTMVSIRTTKLIDSVGRKAKLNTKKGASHEQEIEKIVDSLWDWV